MSPWIQSDEIDGEDGLIGDRLGFEILREGIDRLLQGDEEIVRIEDQGRFFLALQLAAAPLPLQPSTLGEKILTGAIIVVFLSIPLLALFGLTQLIRIIF
ncbi:hypothetical protein OJ996_16950 [Luteolibacter sp. GHJ8]|uniref:Uncharacterized protein n=1 Tax=Luteolibacter rhizosphaerae TaxID=2989719 RepID=A0ABT3G612_9BACT|nr:hypothetical protein [Luteolibacter rhizosphaerae]MCW1915278.1 hypothetical protein [Luteolibacter rhizosphaerae]